MFDYQLVISATNMPNKKDASGAFIPWGMAHARFLSGSGYRVKVTRLDLTARGAELDDFVPCNTLIFYGHGYKNGLQLMRKNRDGLTKLARQLNRNGVQNFYAYACSFLGSRDAVLEKFMCDAGLRLLWGHTTAGHCALNPNMAWVVRDTENDVNRFSYDKTITRLVGKKKATIRALIASTRDATAPLFALLPELKSGGVLARLEELPNG